MVASAHSKHSTGSKARYLLERPERDFGYSADQSFENSSDQRRSNIPDSRMGLDEEEDDFVHIRSDLCIRQRGLGPMECVSVRVMDK